MGKEQKRQSVASACNACRSKKSKCSGERPRCSKCRHTKTACVYNTNSADETHQRASLRRLAELERKTDAHEQLFEQIRVSTSDGALALFHRLRTGDATEGAAGHSLSDPPTPLLKLEDGAGELVREVSAASLLHVLASSADDESSMLLARLRTGEPWEHIASSILATARMNNPDASSDRSQTQDGTISDPLSRLHRMGLQSQPSVDDAPDMVQSHTPSLFNRNIWKRASKGKRRDDPPVEDQLRSSQRSDMVTAPRIWTTNHRTLHMRSSLVQNVLLPVWAMCTINDPLGQIPDPYEEVFQEVIGYIDAGFAAETLCGPHAFLGALDNEMTHSRAPKLSQIVANIVNSIKAGEDEPSITKLALMWLYWTLWRWILTPSPSTYRDVPAFMRPTPYQLFAYHARVFDFVVSPTLRDYMCQIRNPDCAWLSEACVTVACEWPDSVVEVLCRNESTGEMDLSDECKGHVSAPEHWSFGSSVRPLLRNADRYIRIR